MIFVDTGAFLGRYLANDQHHQEAQSLWQKLRQQRLPCLTSNFVLAETFTLLARRSSYRFAAEKARTIYASAAFQILRPDAKDEARRSSLWKSSPTKASASRIVFRLR